MALLTCFGGLVLAGGSFAAIGSSWVPAGFQDVLLLGLTAGTFVTVCAAEARSGS